MVNDALRQAMYEYEIIDTLGTQDGNDIGPFLLLWVNNWIPSRQI